MDNKKYKFCRLKLAGEVRMQRRSTAASSANHPSNEVKSIFKTAFFNLWSLTWTQNPVGGWHLEWFFQKWVCQSRWNLEAEGFHCGWSLGRFPLMRDLSGSLKQHTHTNGCLLHQTLYLCNLLAKICAAARNKSWNRGEKSVGNFRAMSCSGYPVSF